MSKILKILFLLCFSVSLWAQPSNDECEFAQFLGTITGEFCTDINEYNNVGATLSPEPVTGICDANDNDVWFEFRVTAQGALIDLFGNNSLQDVSYVLYSGFCDDLTQLACGDSDTDDLVQLTTTDLTIGQSYFLRVDGSNQGTFQLCIRSFTPVPLPESDCIDAVVLCDKSSFSIQNLDDTGDVAEINEPDACFNGESASVWYTWTCDDPGSLTFTLTPNNPNNAEEDLDFLVYELPGGLNDCASKRIIRCMASGETVGAPAAQNEPCFGPTGLAMGETDTEERPGCDPGDNNFIAPINMISGVSYALVVNNFSETGFGFSIDFGGTGTFLGPEANFDALAVEAFECDKTVIFTDLSDSQTDPIVNWAWNFGVGADPPNATGEGPHNVDYESFGIKTVVLTVESSRGCLVTEILDVEINECCDDNPQVSLDADVVDLSCNGIATGQILPIGIGGTPRFEYSLDGENWQSAPIFNGLDAGTYEVYIRDIKGCVEQTIVEINEPPAQMIDAGPDGSIDLGETYQISASYSPAQAGDTIIWCVDGVPIDTFDAQGFQDCIDCLDPEVLAFGSNTYEIKVINEAGCEVRDEITIETIIVRPIYAPNIFNPNGNFINEIFHLGVGKQVKSIQLFEIYDRWGNLVYTEDGGGQGLVLNNDPGDIMIDSSRPLSHHGWDGRYGNEFASPGVYAWLAKICFIDDEEIFYSGEVTLIREE